MRINIYSDMMIYFSEKFRLIGKFGVSFYVLGAFILLLGISGCAKPPKATLKVGDAAPNFKATDINGKQISLSSLQGQPVIMRFFLPDCKYCRADTEIFNQYYDDYKSKGLNVLYLNTDPEPTEVLKFVEDLRIKFPVILDSSREIADLYRVKAVPQAIFLDPSHKIIGAILGGVSQAEMDDLLKSFLTD